MEWLQNMKKSLSAHEFRTATAKLLQGVSVEDQVEALEALMKEVK